MSSLKDAVLKPCPKCRRVFTWKEPAKAWMQGWFHSACQFCTHEVLDTQEKVDEWNQRAEER